MKIGLISLNNTKIPDLNFACPLHTYAFQQFLLQNGIESTVINYVPAHCSKSFDAKHPLFTYLKEGFEKSFSPEELLINESYDQKKQMKKTLNSQKKVVQNWIDLFYEREIRYNKIQEFVDNNLIQTEKCYDWEMLDLEDPGFDCYICVTDVIWKDVPNYSFDKGFFLACKAMEGKKKIAYAASRGPYYGWSDETVQKFISYIQPFNYISVRETSLKEHIESISDKKAKVVLDPVFLHDRDFYQKLSIPPRESNYVLLYDVMEKATDSVISAVRFAESKGLKLIELSDRKENSHIPAGTWHEVRYGLGIEEWLGYIEHADYIFTNSFHCCCFAIIFEKELFVGKRKGDKVDMVLDTFELAWRRLNSETDIINQDIIPIDYQPIRQILKERKQASMEYILDAIHSTEKIFQLETNSKIKYRIHYHSGANADEVVRDICDNTSKVVRTPKGAWEYQRDTLIDNETAYQLQPNFYNRYGYHFLGWNIRFTIDRQTKWYCTDGNFHSSDEIAKISGLSKYLFCDGETISHLPFNYVSQNKCFVLVAEAVWEKDFRSLVNEKIKYSVNYRSESNPTDTTWEYSNKLGRMTKIQDNIWEYQGSSLIKNKSLYRLLPNGFNRQDYEFSGWNGYTTIDGQMKWYCTDGNFHSASEISETLRFEKYLFKDEEVISCLPFNPTDNTKRFTFILEAVWTKNTYYIAYHSGVDSTEITYEYLKKYGVVKKTKKGAWEYRCKVLIENELPYHLLKNNFQRQEYIFLGWNGRINIDKQTYWYCTDGTFHSASEISESLTLKKYLFHDGETVSHLPLDLKHKNEHPTLVMEAVWTKNTYYIVYHSGTIAEDIAWNYSERYGIMKQTPKGAWEFHCNIPMEAGKFCRLKANRFIRPGYVFSGWKGRITNNGEIWWYCTDGSFHSNEEVKNNAQLAKYLFFDCESIRSIPLPTNLKNKFVLEASWRRE